MFKQYTVVNMQQQLDYNLLKIFTILVEKGSYTQAAKHFNCPKSKISRAITRLEEELNLQLVRRTTREVVITSLGLELNKKIQKHFEIIESDVSAITNMSKNVSGVLRVTASEDMAQAVLVDLVVNYTRLYPNVKVDMVITNEFLNLNKENVDIGIRIGKLKDSSLIQRKLLDLHVIMVATPNYIKTHGDVNSVKDLKNHNMLLFKEGVGFHELFSLNKTTVKLNSNISTNSFPTLLNMALNDKGIAYLPDFFCQKYLESGELVRVLPSKRGIKRPLHMVYTQSKVVPNTIRTFIDEAIKKQEIR